ncbi:ABC transporter substrate-binding protein [Vineibacter terrae]|nr:ABC transporter substrate-binding protein [Vineibacter terrae]
MYRIGWLVPGSPTPDGARLQDSFREGLRMLGHVEGREYMIEFRWALGRPELLPELAAELVRLPADVIVTVTSQTAHAAKAATTQVPILFITPDPLSTGLVTNLARPEANVTGITMLPGPEIIGKYLQLLADVVGGAARIAVLWNESSPWQSAMMGEAEAAAHRLRIKLIPVAFRDPDDFASSFARMKTARADAVVALPDATTFVHRKRLVDLALQHRLPALLTHLEGAMDGALMVFATDLNVLFRRAASYVNRLMKGAAVGDLPVEQPTTFRLAINMKTAKALGLTIPPAILARADEVIE